MCLHYCFISAFNIALFKSGFSTTLFISNSNVSALFKSAFSISFFIKVKVPCSLVTAGAVGITNRDRQTDGGQDIIPPVFDNVYTISILISSEGHNSVENVDGVMVLFLCILSEGGLYLYQVS